MGSKKKKIMKQQQPYNNIESIVSTLSEKEKEQLKELIYECKNREKVLNDLHVLKTKNLSKLNTAYSRLSNNLKTINNIIQTTNKTLSTISATLEGKNKTYH